MKQLCSRLTPERVLGMGERGEPGMADAGKGAVIEADEGDVLSVDVDNGKITNETSKKSWSFPEYPPYIKELIASGGLMARLKGGK